MAGVLLGAPAGEIARFTINSCGKRRAVDWLDREVLCRSEEETSGRSQSAGHGDERDPTYFEGEKRKRKDSGFKRKERGTTFSFRILGGNAALVTRRGRNKLRQNIWESATERGGPIAQPGCRGRKRVKRRKCQATNFKFTKKCR